VPFLPQSAISHELTPLGDYLQRGLIIFLGIFFGFPILTHTHTDGIVDMIKIFLIIISIIKKLFLMV